MRLKTGDGKDLWLSYGMNVHPGGAAGETLEAVSSTVQPLRDRLGAAGPFGIAVRWSCWGVEQLQEDEDLRIRLAHRLRDADLVPFTGNAFVYGDFHGEPLKEEVYRPPWSDPARTSYTLGFAELLAGLNQPGASVTLSTSPCSWRAWKGGEAELEACATQLAACARGLRELEDRTGVRVRLGIEPEPRCTLETTDELRAFFAGPLGAALDDDTRPYLGMCYDVCHQAIVHEDVGASLDALLADGIPIVKVQASCALQCDDPSDDAARAALAHFDEPVYLHQVGARDADGRVHMAEDLPTVLGDEGGAWIGRKPWRIHFHVPVFRAEAVPPLRTTQPELDAVLTRVAAGGVTDQVEIETYTWDELPEAEREAGSGFNLVDALAREYAHVLGALGAGGADVSVTT